MHAIGQLEVGPNQAKSSDLQSPLALLSRVFQV